MQVRRRGDQLEKLALDTEEKARAALAAKADAVAGAEAAAQAASETERRAADAQSALETRRQLACTLAVQLSDSLRRSGAVDASAPMLCDSSASAWPWEQLALTLSGLVSHTCYYWAAHQRELGEVALQLKQARARLAEKEESLSRAAMIATGLKRATALAAPTSRRVPHAHSAVRPRPASDDADLVLV